MKKFTFWRNAIIAETYEVVANSKEEAIEELKNGLHDPIHTEWVDWADGSYELEDTEELDPLYVMVKEYGNGVRSI